MLIATEKKVVLTQCTIIYPLYYLPCFSQLFTHNDSNYPRTFELCYFRAPTVFSVTSLDLMNTYPETWISSTSLPLGGISRQGQEFPVLSGILHHNRKAKYEYNRENSWLCSYGCHTNKASCMYIKWCWYQCHLNIYLFLGRSSTA